MTRQPRAAPVALLLPEHAVQLSPLHAGTVRILQSLIVKNRQERMINDGKANDVGACVGTDWISF